MSEPEISEVSGHDTEMLRRIGRLRIEAWATVIPRAAVLQTWLDDVDPIARHWVALEDGKLIGAARLSVHGSIEELPDRESFNGIFDGELPAPIASFNRLVVVESARGQGLGGRFVVARLKAAREMGCRCAVSATPFGEWRTRQLRRNGFRIVGVSRSGYQGGPFVFQPIVEETILFCDLPHPGRGTTGSDTDAKSI